MAIRAPLLLGVLLGLAAWTWDQGGEDAALNGFEQIGTGDAVVWRHADPGGYAMLARVEGRVAHDAACGVHLVGKDGRRHSIVWPSGVEVVRDDPLRLRLSGGETIEVGQRITGGGGYGGASLGFPCDHLGAVVLQPSGELMVD